MLGFDLETYPIGPRRAPKVIVGAMNIRVSDAENFSVSEWATRVKDVEPCEYEHGGEPRSVYFFWADRLGDFLTLCEDINCYIVAHNAAYDWSCISAMDATYVNRVYDLYQSKKVQCTYIRSLIYLNSRGELKTKGNSKVELQHGKYGTTSLVGSCATFCGLDLSEVKDHDIQITYYKVEPIRNVFEWPKAYREYLVQDVEFLSDLFFSQESRGTVPLRETYGQVYIFEEACRRASFHFSLTLASAWGLRVDGEAVRKLRRESEDEVQVVADQMVANGFASQLKGKPRERALERGKITIKVDNKMIQGRISDCYKSRGEQPPLTSKGTVSTSRTVLFDCGDDLLRRWAEVGDKKTIWSTFIPALEKSFESDGVLNTSFFPYSETGRVSARKPNLLNPPRSGGIRECIKAREGCTFIFCDYEANELRVLAQVLLDKLKKSRLAELYIEDPEFDPHTYMACRRLKIPYEEGKRLKAEGDKELKSIRQLMKCCNFGFPGGMASRTFIEFAKGYGVVVTEAEADELKAFFFSQFPEIKEYLDRVGTQVNRYDGQGYLKRVGRVSGDRRFCQLANFYFQGLAAEGGLTAFATVSREAYCNPDSPLYGSRPVLFVHDEIIMESPLHKAHEAAMELKRIMEKSMGYFTPEIPSLAEPTLALRWWKGAYQKFDEQGRLVPSDVD
jgi:DNA polymerase I